MIINSEVTSEKIAQIKFNKLKMDKKSAKAYHQRIEVLRFFQSLDTSRTSIWIYSSGNLLKGYQVRYG
ncbi:MAG: hypothetical protein ACXAEU_00730 [Candidatus Hodarchaeales archaeon]